MSFFFKYVGFLIYTIRFFLLAYIFLCPFSINAQSGVVVSGKNIENTSGSMSYTIGDVFYTKNIRGISINEGMQQSYIINEIASKSKLRVSLYPNPTNNLVYFKVENLNYKYLSFKLYDISGRMITSGRILNEQSVLSLQNFPNNIFIVKVFRGELEEQSFKILKSN
jgi:hypothetical protein